MVRSRRIHEHVRLLPLLAALAGCSTGQPSNQPPALAAVPTSDAKPGDSGPTAQSFDARAVDGLLDQAREAWGVPGVAVAIVRGDEVVYLKGSGVKDLNTRAPVTPDTIFPLASCTKGFTTTAMAMLVDEGKMSWDDPVRKHVAFFHLSDPLADANVTLRDLVTHRTGLGSHELLWYRSPWSQEEIIRRIGRVKLDYSFRSRFHYQTTMFQTAGYAVGVASHGTWADFVRRRIAEPLGMTSVSFTTAEAEKTDDHASPHRPGRTGRLEVIPWYKIEAPNPAGSINATARDLSKWVRLHLGAGTFEAKRLVSAANLGVTQNPQMIIPLEGVTRALNPDTIQLSYGMAWVIQDYRCHRLVSHAGAIDGFRAHITLVPDSQLGIVLLSNLHETRMNLAVSNTLVDLLLGLPRKDWNAYLLKVMERESAAARARREEPMARRQPNAKPPRELTAYAGTYEEPAYGTARVTLEDGSLVWHWSTFTNRLQHFHDDTFLVDNDAINSPQVVFMLGANGEVASMKVLEPLGVEFKKVQPAR